MRSISYRELERRRDDLRASFRRLAWIIPVLLPTLFSIGRANGSIFSVTYLLWGLAAIRLRDCKGHGLLVGAYLGVLATFSLGIFDALDPEHGINTYVKFSFSLLTVFFTILALRDNPYRRDIPLWFGVTALVAIGVFLARLAYYSLQPGFIPSVQVNGMAAAALLPLACVFFCHYWGQRKGGGLIVALYLITLIGLVFADSRTELMMALLGAAVFYGFYFRRIWTVAVVGLIGLPLVIGINQLLRDDSLALEHQWFAVINQLTSLRLSVWSVPFIYPPDNPWIGVGMGNAGIYVEAAAIGAPVKHMHNFILEVGYETGWLGLIALAGFFWVLLRRVPTVYRVLQDRQRLWFTAVLASAVAVVIAAALDKGYTDPLFRVYLMFCLAALYVWSREAPPRPEVAHRL